MRCVACAVLRSEDPIKGVTVSGITEYSMETAADVFSILQRGAVNRTTDSHQLNQARALPASVFALARAGLTAAP